MNMTNIEDRPAEFADTLTDLIADRVRPLCYTEARDLRTELVNECTGFVDRLNEGSTEAEHDEPVFALTEDAITDVVDRLGSVLYADLSASLTTDEGDPICEALDIDALCASLTEAVREAAVEAIRDVAL